MLSSFCFLKETNGRQEAVVEEKEELLFVGRGFSGLEYSGGLSPPHNKAGHGLLVLPRGQDP